MSRIVIVHPHCANPNVGSVRAYALEPAKWLTSLGHLASVVRDIQSAKLLNPDIVICVNIGIFSEKYSLVNNAMDPKIRWVGLQSDGPQATDEVLQKLSIILTDSEFLLTTIPQRFRHKTIYIDDALDFNPDFYKPHTHPKRKLRLVWIGSGGNYFFADSIITELKKGGWYVDVISDPSIPIALPWTIDGAPKLVNEYDVGIVPYPENLTIVDPRSFTRWRYKDNSRSLLIQAVGLPVVCSPLPSHLLYIKHGQTGLIANTIFDWKNALEDLQNDESLYNSLAANGYKQAVETAHPNVLKAKWKSIIDRALT